MSASDKSKIYDVFISHRSENRPWVEVLARNLKDYGYRVFLDIWEMVPGKSLASSLYQALRQSSKGILVVTPEAIESGWVGQEYEQMIAQKAGDPNFRIIPVVLGQEIPDFPFLQTMIWIDFRDPKDYRRSFYHLLCAIEDRSPGPDIMLEKDIKLPTEIKEETAYQPRQDEKSFVENLFEMFYTKQAVLLLAQADRLQSTMKAYLLRRTEKQYGKANTLHIVPPYSPQADLESYFAVLGRQCHFSEGIINSVSLMTAFEDRLSSGERLFIMVSGFENSCQTGREELAGVLRSLNERYPSDLRILICGGERMADLYYTGSLSFLNQAEAMEIPELTIADVYLMQKQFCPGQGLDKSMAQIVFDVSGGHPRLIELCLNLCIKERNTKKPDYLSTLTQSPFVWQLFTPFAQEENRRERLCQLLRMDEVATFQPYLFDPLIRRLYWKNLLKRDPKNRHLLWRCEVFRIAGQEILGGKERG